MLDSVHTKYIVQNVSYCMYHIYIYKVYIINTYFKYNIHICKIMLSRAFMVGVHKLYINYYSTI